MIRIRTEDYNFIMGPEIIGIYEDIDRAAPARYIEGVFNTTPSIHKIPLIPPLAKGEIVIPLFGRRPIGPPSGA
jgi:hypothetical protein